jgi:hypothetical protein
MRSVRYARTVRKELFRGTAVGLFAMAGLVLGPQLSEARVVNFEVLSTESPTFEGRGFGEVGPYEKIIGRATIAVDPKDPRNAKIVDLDKAPVNANGEVEFTADVAILRPVEGSKASGALFYDVLNRGRKRGLGLLNDAPYSNNPTTAEEAGNAFLMNRGDTIVWSGWQGDLAPGDDVMVLDAPAAAGITGQSREEFIFDKAENPAKGELSYPAADLDPSKATLTVRAREADERQQPADLSFRYLSPTEIEITRPAGFDDGAIYEFIYPAKDPKVLGTGFLATRDIVSFLRGTEAGHEAENPLAEAGGKPIDRTLALGISQSGRFLRDMTYQGFNEDEAGQRVFDGIIPHITGSRKTFTNYRFAQPGRYSRQHEDHAYPGDQFPFTYAEMTDPLTGKTDSILSACLQNDTCPKVMHTDTATEAWQARNSLIVTDTQGQAIELPDTVRAYYLAGAPHSNAFGAEPKAAPTCVHLSNPLHVGAPMRAIVASLDEWVSEGTEPPASRFPSPEDGTLVPPSELNYPEIPGFTYEGIINELRVMDHTAMPPEEGEAYPIFVPAVDEDGHEKAGIMMPNVSEPLATYLGWNARRAGFAEGALCSLTGSYLPLPRTEEDRQASGDERRSIADRYPTAEAYAEAVRTAAEELAVERLLLPEDVALFVAAAPAAYEKAMQAQDSADPEAKPAQ